MKFPQGAVVLLAAASLAIATRAATGGRQQFVRGP